MALAVSWPGFSLWSGDQDPTSHGARKAVKEKEKHGNSKSRFSAYVGWEWGGLREGTSKVMADSSVQTW